MIIEYDTIICEFIISAGTIDDYLTKNNRAIKTGCVINPYRILTGTCDSITDAIDLIRSHHPDKNIKSNDGYMK